MFGLFTLLAKATELKNRTYFYSFTKGVYSVTLESNQFVYYYYYSYSSSIKYGSRIANIIAGDLPSDIQIGYSESYYDPPSEYYSFSQTNKGYVSQHNQTQQCLLKTTETQK